MMTYGDSAGSLFDRHPFKESVTEIPGSGLKRARPTIPQHSPIGRRNGHRNLTSFALALDKAGRLVRLGPSEVVV
jgi:hypothetical protein